MKYEITDAELKNLLAYDPCTGEFRWRLSSRRFACGDVAGRRFKSGYLKIRVLGTYIFSHRLVFLYMTGSFPSGQCDHINGIRDDNRWCNLRVVSNVENARNQKLRCTNSSGTFGIYWYKPAQKWRVQIGTLGRRKHIGLFDDLEDAVKARKEAEGEYGFHPNHGRTQ